MFVRTLADLLSLCAIVLNKVNDYLFISRIRETFILSFESLVFVLRRYFCSILLNLADASEHRLFLGSLTTWMLLGYLFDK